MYCQCSRECFNPVLLALGAVCCGLVYNLVSCYVNYFSQKNVFEMHTKINNPVCTNAIQSLNDRTLNLVWLQSSDQSQTKMNLYRSDSKKHSAVTSAGPDILPKNLRRIKANNLALRFKYNSMRTLQNTENMCLLFTLVHIGKYYIA